MYPMVLGVRFNEAVCAIEFVTKAGVVAYSVDLEDCTTPAKMLDWVMQLASKRWLSDAALGEYVRLLNRLTAPQAYLCSFGRNLGPLGDMREHLARVQEDTAAGRKHLHEVGFGGEGGL